MPISANGLSRLCRIVSHDTITVCKNSTLSAVLDCVTEGPAQVQRKGGKTVGTLEVLRELRHIVSYFVSDTINAYKNSMLSVVLVVSPSVRQNLFWAKKRLFCLKVSTGIKMNKIICLDPKSSLVMSHPLIGK